jgi:restriction system protein
MQFYQDIQHSGLGKYRRVRAADPALLQQLVAAQIAQWNEMWSHKQALDAARNQREALVQEREARKADAAARTAEARAEIDRVEHLLSDGVRDAGVLDWETLKDRSQTATPKPELAHVSPAVVVTPPREPQATDKEFATQLGVLDSLFRTRREAKEASCRDSFRRAHVEWERAKQSADERTRRFAAEHDQRMWQAREAYTRAAQEWQVAREKHEADQARQHAAVDAARRRYAGGDHEAIQFYCEQVLARSKYPDTFPQECEVEYLPDTGVLLLDYRLPSPACMPSTKDVRYVQSRGRFEEVSLPASTANALYDSAVYQIALRTIHEIFVADEPTFIRAVVFNGIVQGTNAATGVESTACVLSVMAQRDDFLNVNLAYVDPKACFRKLKGVGSAKLHALTPVPPIMDISREDRRFVIAHGVAAGLDASSNLASMPWEEFEHLVRELFEAEFASTGGEVKVTQASRDGGVDAIAFDPDPIRGGKIVIQAKRYTNVVGVSAVRDLYGTVINEGATKGILVTTADYGPDAHEFARGKPITLLSGGHLLHLLAKHGHQARINLAEARAEAADDL